MFDNIGAKIKTLATVSCWVGIVASLIGSIVLLIEGELLTALLTAVSGPLSAVHQWRCENCGKMISKDICPFCGKAYGQAAEKIENLNVLRKQGAITPAEYEKRLEKLRFE